MAGAIPAEPNGILAEMLSRYFSGEYMAPNGCLGDVVCILPFTLLNNRLCHEQASAYLP